MKPSPRFLSRFYKSYAQFKPWNYGDPYKHPLPERNEDPWALLMKPLMAKDKARCEAWKDEVQNLLIFVSIGLYDCVFDIVH